MAKLIALGLSLSLLVLLNGCLAYQHQFQSRQQECRLDRLQAREPDNRIEAEAGVTESWDPNDQQFQCAGVAMLRRTIEQNGLHLPSYVNAPQLIYIVRGQGVLGAVFSGCPETFEESQDEQQQQQWQPSRRIRGGQGKEQQQREDQQDRHQKIRHVRQGDVIALPAGVAYWCYNNGNEDLVAVSLIDVNNEQNQLDQLPRRFYLAGNPEDEFDQGQQGRRQHQQRQRGQQGQQQQGQRGQSQWGQQGQQGRRQQQGRGNNVYSGFDTQLLAQALNVDEETARNLQGQNDNRNDIVRVQGQLDFVSPLSQSSGRQQERQQEGEQRQQQQREQQREQQQRRQGGGGQNSHEQTFGLEGSFCHIRLSQNIGDPSRADFYSPNAGRITTLNSRQLPILRHLRLSAEHGVLYNNAMYSPHYNLNANELVYVIRGSARVQVVNENGESILDDEVQEGQLFLVPQNHAAIKQASNDGFEYISFKTENNAVVQTLAGRTSLLRAMPEEVLSNAYQISRQEARQLKYNRQETRVLSASQQSSRGRLSILG